VSDTAATGGKVVMAMAVAAASALITFLGVVGGAVGGGTTTGLAISLTGLVLQAGEACVVSGPVHGLDAAQATIAGEVVSAAFAASAENTQATKIALMVAYTESGLRNLGPQPGNDGSLGVFQQRASEGWGSTAEELNPVDATGMFVQRLLAVPGWSRLAPWVAAQDVQRSAFDGRPSPANGGSSAVGGNYRKNWVFAGQILSAVLAAGNATGSCGQGVPAGVTGPPASHGLPVGYSLPPGTGPAHAKAALFALAQLGKPYVWGASGPASFDCSGLTMASWASAGVVLAHYTVDQQNEGQPVSPAGLEAGDLVLVPGSDPAGPGLPGHVGLYLGFGLVESAIDPQSGVAVQSWATFISGGLDVLRDPDIADG
jgi:cell wall-associated NlpC family hydrolase